MDQNLKHRLTGAIILVSLAVIFIPVILEGPDNEWTPLNQSVPDAPNLNYRAPVSVPLPAEATPVPLKRSHETIEKPVYKLAEPARKKTVEVPVVAPRSVPVAEAAAYADGWYVQAGSFTRELNAAGLSKRLEESGYETSYQKKASGTGFVYRVLVGPSESRDQARMLRDRLAIEFKFKGIVVNNPD